LEDSDSQVRLEIEGKKLQGLYNEAGGHRIQRVPPTETKGRVHTSTVTVAIIDDSYCSSGYKYRKRKGYDFEYEYFKSSGPGGQHKNKVMTAVKCTHVPTGIKQERSGRSQRKNKLEAKEAVIKILDERYGQAKRSQQNDTRKDQVGSGMRGDKRRTYRFQEDRVVDHLNDLKASCKKVLKGNFDLLWKED